MPRNQPCAKWLRAYSETGTPFKKVDFMKLLDKYEQFDADLADDNDTEDDGKGGLMTLSPAPRVGEVDVPVRDMRYIDQRDERFETHIPTFEDEE